MTSRNGSERGSWDQIDAMICCVLRESVADAVPPPGAWQRISERLDQQTRKSRTWDGFRVACNWLALWLLDSVVGPPAQLSYSPDLSRIREAYPMCLLMYQQDLPMLLGQVV